LSADKLPDDLRDQAAMNRLLRRLIGDDRELLARFFARQFVNGVHETLVVLNPAQIPPFEDGYEGTPFHDFMGRLEDWPWPKAD
jgi:hypothetical protein